MDSDTNMIHSCSILGARIDRAKVRESLSLAIDRAISEGYTTFITSVFTEYEQDAIRHISEIRKTDSSIQLVLVVPYVADKARLKARYFVLYQAATKIVNAAETKDPDPYIKTIAWMVEHSKRILYVKASNRSRKDMIRDLDLRNKELYIIAANHNISNRVKGTNPIYSIYPFNLLCEILQSEPPEDLIIPPDFEVRLDNLLARIDSRTYKIMILRYKQGHTLQEIGDRFELGRERVRKIIQYMINKLQSQENMLYLLGQNNGEPADAASIAKSDPDLE